MSFETELNRIIKGPPEVGANRIGEQLDPQELTHLFEAWEDTAIKPEVLAVARQDYVPLVSAMVRVFERDTGTHPSPAALWHRLVETFAAGLGQSGLPLEIQFGITTPAELSPAMAEKLDKTRHEAEQFSASIWRDVPAWARAGEVFNLVVEIPEGSRDKFEFEIKTNQFVLDRVLPDSVPAYPANYGFVPSSFYHDGDPIDVLVLGPPARTGEVVRARVIGVMYMVDQKGLDSKIIAIPEAWGDPQDCTAYGPDDLTAIEHFFEVYKSKDGDPNSFSDVLGWSGLAAAREELDKSISFFSES